MNTSTYFIFKNKRTIVYFKPDDTYIFEKCNTGQKILYTVFLKYFTK